MSELVDKLSNGEHKVTVKRYETIEQIREAIDRGFILIKFTETQGGTEIGYEIDFDKSNVDLDSQDKEIFVVGKFELDFVPVECSAKINLDTLEGSGFLTKIEENETAEA